MNSRFPYLLATLAMLSATSTWSQTLPPPSGGPYQVQKQAIAGGGQRASGAIYVLTGTVGQSNAASAPASGASYLLTGGFHARALPLRNDIFKNGFEN